MTYVGLMYGADCCLNLAVLVTLPPPDPLLTPAAAAQESSKLKENTQIIILNINTRTINKFQPQVLKHNMTPGVYR